MTRLSFRNAICILRSIDGWELYPAISAERARKFMADPVGFFLRADDATAEAIWRVVESRLPPHPPAPVQLVFTTINEAA